jgi:glycolate oxidase FAD binding subunit
MTIRPRWLSSAEKILKPTQICSEVERLQEYVVDGLVPSAVVYPETFDEVAAVLLWAQEERLAMLPWGSGTAIHAGGPSRRNDIVLSTSRLRHISEYDAENLTITAEAGVTFAQVARLTAEHLQTLPLQYSFSAASLGGLIATNAHNPKRLLYGSVRDLLLGIRVALPGGEIAHFGGKVVKNVAGYDMCKLFLGSLGALGIIVEATFKLYALPERDETLLAAFPGLGQGAAAVAQLMGTQLLPSQMLLLNPTAARAAVPQVATQLVAGGTLLLVNCEGMDEAVERQLVDIARICQGHGASTVQVLAGDAQLQFRQRLEATARYPAATTLSSLPEPSAFSPSPSGRGQGEGSDVMLPLLPHLHPLPEGEGTKHLSQRAPLEGEGTDGGALTVRLGTLPSRVYTVMEEAAQALNPGAPGAMIVGDCGVGLVKLCIQWEGLAAGVIDESLLRALRDLSRLVVADGGYAVVESAPPEVKTRLEVWGPPPSSFALLKALKNKFDPEGLLSPGRFIGGL